MKASRLPGKATKLQNYTSMKAALDSACRDAQAWQAGCELSSFKLISSFFEKKI